METKKAGRKKLGDEAYDVIQTTFRAKRKYLKTKEDKQMWADYLRECIKRKESELQVDISN